MSRPSWFQRLYWSRFAKPAEERALFKHLLEQPVHSILEVGVGDGQRMRRIAQLAVAAGSDPIRYIGTDEFESATDGQRHLTLKQAHQIAGQLGFKASLIPGDASSALPRVAHKLGTSDLVVISGGLDTASPAEGPIGAWLNRLAHQESTIFAASAPGQELKLVRSETLDLSIRRAA